MITIIKSEEQYDDYLGRVEVLMDIEPIIDTPESDELELLTLLIENYEEVNYPIDMPTPIEAIKFRMEQQGLTQKDLIPYLGCRSKVSEVLRGKRNLSLKMIRALHHQLGIPAEILLGNEKTSLPENPFSFDWRKFPIKEMIRRDYISYSGTLQKASDFAEELIEPFMHPYDSLLSSMSFCRQHIRTKRPPDTYALKAWQVQIMHRCNEYATAPFSLTNLDENFHQEFRQLTLLADGPLHAISFLNRYGIQLVIEPHLPKTYLDGWVFWDKKKNPIIALTLRYDRTDNFWFTLAHEISHLLLHFQDTDITSIVDEIDSKATDAIEQEADVFAEKFLIPHWDASLLSYTTADEIFEFAQIQNINPAIVAGRIRKELSNYHILSQMVGFHKVRNLFCKHIEPQEVSR